jgi:hypothetical protein
VRDTTHPMMTMAPAPIQILLPESCKH